MVQKPKQKKLNNETSNGKKIVTVNCNVRLGGEAVFIEYKEVTYITSQTLVNKLLNGTLRTKDGKKSNHIKMGILDQEEGIIENNSWLTRKEDAIYFSPSKDEVLIGSVTGLANLLKGEWPNLKLGKFE